MEWFKTRTINNKTEVFDPVRKKYVLLSPEEEVRQITLHQMVGKWDYPPGLIAVEYSFDLHKLKKRSDIVVFSKSLSPLMIVECKARHIPITQATVDQAMRYNLKLKVNFLVLTNAETTFVVKLLAKDNEYEFLQHFPFYHDLLKE